MISRKITKDLLCISRGGEKSKTLHAVSSHFSLLEVRNIFHEKVRQILNHMMVPMLKQKSYLGCQHKLP